MTVVSEYSNSDLNMLIIRVLKKNSSSENTLNLGQIVSFLKTDFIFSTTVRTVGPALKRLIKIDSNIMYDTIETENSFFYCNWWYKQLFSDGELRFCIDCVKYCKHISTENKVSLCQNLKNLSYSKNLDKVVSNVSFSECTFEINPNYLLNVEMINKAIMLKKEIKFKMQVYDIFKNFSIILDKAGNEVVYNVVPLDIVIKDGVYYLIARFNSLVKYNFRIDKILNVEILDKKNLDEPIKYTEQNIDKYLDERVHLYSGDVSRITLKIKKNFIIDKLVTDFDSTVSFSKNSDGDIYAVLNTNKITFDIWILKYKDCVEIVNF